MPRYAAASSISTSNTVVVSPVVVVTVIVVAFVVVAAVIAGVVVVQTFVPPALREGKIVSIRFQVTVHAIGTLNTILFYLTSS